MSKASSAATQFLQKNRSKSSIDPFKEAFEAKAPGKQNSFSEMFGNIKLSELERQAIRDLLADFKEEERKDAQVEKDLELLFEITSNVKGIKAQSLLLQGEQIKKAQNLLKSYRDGAFTRWLIAAYGNRQTPYSILQYYELYQQLPVIFQKKIELMPKKAAYAIAAREGLMEKKIEVLEKYDASKDQAADIILLLQESLPKKQADRRQKNFIAKTLLQMHKLASYLPAKRQLLSPRDQEAIGQILQILHSLHS